RSAGARRRLRRGTPTSGRCGDCGARPVQDRPRFVTLAAPGRPVREGPTMPEAAVNGTTIHYRDVGSGPALLFVHGLGLTHQMWHPQVEHFAVHHRVITVDVRGAGASGRLSSDQPVLATQADDLA